MKNFSNGRREFHWLLSQTMNLSYPSHKLSTVSSEDNHYSLLRLCLSLRSMNYIKSENTIFKN